MRRDLEGILHQGESIRFDVDEPKGTKSSSAFGAELGLFLFFGSFFIIAIVGILVFGLLKGLTLSAIASQSTVPAIWLVLLAIAIGFAHKSITKTLKLTSVIITNERLFYAPPAEYVQKAGWEGPKQIADIVFADQLSVRKGTYLNSPCLIFTSISRSFNTVGDDQLPLRKRYIPFADVDIPYDNLPVFLKTPELQFDETPTESPTPRYQRAVRFLADRKTKLGQI